MEYPKAYHGGLVGGQIQVNPIRNYPVVGDPGIACPAGPQLAVDTNDLEWITINTLAGAAQADILIQFSKPRRRIQYISNHGAAAREIFLYLSPFNTDKAAGGVLSIDGTEQWFFLLPSDGTVGLASSDNLHMIEFRQPISKIFLAHPDFGTGTNIVLVAGEDVMYNQGFQNF